MKGVVGVDDPELVLAVESVVVTLVHWLWQGGQSSCSAWSTYRGRSKCLCSITDQVGDAAWVEERG